MAGEANKQSQQAESVNRIFLFSDDAAFAAENRSLTKPEGSYLTVNKAVQPATGSPVAKKLGGDVHAVYQTNQTNPGTGRTSPTTPPWSK